MRSFSHMDTVYGLCWFMQLDGLVDHTLLSTDELGPMVDNLLSKYDVLRQGNN